MGDNGLGMPGLAFDGTTTNKHDFRHWEGAKPSEQAIRSHGRATTVPDDRDWNTEVSSQFVPKGGAKRSSRAPPERRNQSLPFAGVTTNQADFRQWDIKPVQSFHRTQGWKPRPDNRDFSTEGRAEYTKKQFDVCPAVDVAVSSKPINGHVLVRNCVSVEHLTDGILILSIFFSGGEARWQMVSHTSNLSTTSTGGSGPSSILILQCACPSFTGHNF